MTPPATGDPSWDDRVGIRLGLSRGANAPAKLFARAGLAVAALVAMFAALAVATAASNNALDVIGHEAGPQVIATTDLYYALADADAQVATVLLLGASDPDGKAEAEQAYAVRRGEIAAALLEAHRLSGEDEAQRGTIESIMESYGEYEQLAAEAMLLAEQLAYPEGEAPPQVIEAYRLAGDLMSGRLLPLSYNLSLENATIVRETYDRAGDRIDTGRAVVLAAGAAALAALVWLQLHIARAFRRVFNPSLLVATAVCLLYLFTGAAVLSAEASALHQAKETGFDRALSLAQAKAVSEALYTDQVRYLLDTERAAVYEQTYLDKAQSLYYLESGNLDGYREALAADTAGSRTPRPGLIGAGLDGDEESAALADAWSGVNAADAAMREGAGPVSDRLAEVQAATEPYREALARLTERRSSVFEDGIADGERAVADFAFLLPAAMVSLAAFTFTGIAPRLREFR